MAAARARTRRRSGGRWRAVLARRSRAALLLARGDAAAAAETRAGAARWPRRRRACGSRAGARRCCSAARWPPAATGPGRSASCATPSSRWTRAARYALRDEARRELRRLGHRVDQARRRGAPSALAGLAALSAREREVVALVAAGPDEPGDRRGALPVGQDGRDPPAQRLRQARRDVAGRGRRRVRTRRRLLAGLAAEHAGLADADDLDVARSAMSWPNSTEWPATLRDERAAVVGVAVTT